MYPLLPLSALYQSFFSFLIYFLCPFISFSISSFLYSSSLFSMHFPAHLFLFSPSHLSSFLSFPLSFFHSSFISDSTFFALASFSVFVRCAVCQYICLYPFLFASPLSYLSGSLRSFRPSVHFHSFTDYLRLPVHFHLPLCFSHFVSPHSLFLSFSLLLFLPFISLIPPGLSSLDLSSPSNQCRPRREQIRNRMSFQEASVMEVLKLPLNHFHHHSDLI